MTTLQKRKPIRSKAIRAAARGQSCAVCGCNDGTTVFVHLDESWAGKGMGQKADDVAGFFACYRCHLGYAGDPGGNYAISYYDIARAMYRTLRILFDMGIIRIMN